ncbi:MAG: enoyl-CoA hydratase/isomerase family protein [Streptosporangiaceae bacterium]
MINTYTVDGNVHVLQFDHGENRFSPEFLQAANDALGKLEQETGALVTTGTGKYFSNGLDLDWLGANGDRLEPYLGEVHKLYARFINLPLPTVAALNGHAFAGGGMLALTHDFVLMRADRGWFCLPEVDLGMPFTPGMGALIQSRLSRATAHEAMVTGRRYTAPEAIAAGIAQRSAPEEEVLSSAIDWARTFAAKDGRSVARIRRGMYGPVLDALAL